MADNVLYYGDNLDVLRRHIKDETIDLVYLDPPFNSNAEYNVLFAEQNGSRSAAQIRAFEDTWRWDQAAAKTYQEVVESSTERVSKAMQAFRMFLGESDMMAYIAMMAPRLVELRRVLKPGGSIYLHCDPTASHYIKMLMDAVFGPENFLNEIIWKRTSAHSSAKRCGPVHDVILLFAKTQQFTWNEQHMPYDQEYLDQFYRHVDEKGRKFRLSDITGSGVRHGETGEPWRGVEVTPRGRHWMVPPSELDRLDAEGRVYWPKKGEMPAYKRYLDEMPGVPLQDVWTDLKPIGAQAAERLGYPTQKPEALLERIIKASSNAGDLVLDPFCGCGTTIVVAERLNRRWIGVDITRLAVTLMKHRLNDAFGGKVSYKVVGEPVSVTEAVALAKEDPYQFQWWALGMVGARPVEEKKGADKGIDGRLFIHDEPTGGKTKQIIFQVKAGHVTAAHIRDLRGVLEREKAEIGILIAMQNPTVPMKTEAAGAGFYDSPWGTRHARIQIIPVRRLFEPRPIDTPPLRQTNVTFKKAPRVRESSAASDYLPFSDKK
jgi:DNA modification methylase